MVRSSLGSTKMAPALQTIVRLFLLLASLPRSSRGMGGAFLKDHRRHRSGYVKRDEGFDWYGITPTDDIVWTDCYDQYKCSRVNLPLDYSRPDGPKVQIALQMKPATNMADYKGTIFINPGGPGGSGTKYVNLQGDMLASIVGPEFDILGFDPRGVGATTPLALCFQSDSQLAVWRLQEVLSLNQSDNSIPLARAREHVVGERCLRALGGNGREDIGETVYDWGLGRFMDTGSVATDMLRISEKLGQEKLQYLGASYGTVLGQYFAAIYPDKVGRMLLDGVLDGTNYRAALWNSLQDADAVIASFYGFCHYAGPSKCPVYESTVEEIKGRVDRAVYDLTPIAVPFASQGPAVIREVDMIDLLFFSTYSPVDIFPILAEIIVAIETNNQTALAAFTDGFSLSYKCDCEHTPPPWWRQTQAYEAITCSDADPVLDTPAEFGTYFNDLLQKSSVFAPIGASDRLQCAEWKIRPKLRYTGPLSSNTSFPILFTSATFDPVCPLDNAQAVQKRYPGSALLVQNSYGHCAISVPSNCTALAWRAYFADGVLPEPGTVCEPNILPFMDQ